MRIERIGDATLTIEDAELLPRYVRYRLRKKGVNVPFVPQKSGFRQTQEHIEKRTRRGSDHYAWQGDLVSERGGRNRALRLYPKIPPCERCGNEKSERHHRDGNTANNAPDNIAPLCRKCHMEVDGRLEAFVRGA